MSDSKEICWCVKVKLSDVCSKITDGSHFSPKSVDMGFPYVTVKDLKNDTIDFSKCIRITKNDFANLSKNDCNPLRNDILFSKDGTVGKVTLINYDKQFVVLSSLAILRPRIEIILPKYLFFILKSSAFLLQALNQKKGVAIRRIILRDLKEISFNLPPISEQHRIVAKIEELFSSLDKGIESLKTTQSQLKTYRQSVLKWAFEGKLTNKKVQDGELPTGWKWVKISEFLIHPQKGMATGPFGTSLKKEEHKESGVPVLGIENIGEGTFKPNNKIFVGKEKAEELKSFKVVLNDIIISRSGTVGEICCVPASFENALISTNLIRVRLNQNVISPKYFVYLFQGGVVREQVKELCKGSTRAFLNQTILNSLNFPYCPPEEQLRIISEIETRLSVCDKLEENIAQSLAQAEALRQSILKKAFEGKLVPQDPNDEPAGVMLERIRAERGASVKDSLTVTRKQKKS